LLGLFSFGLLTKRAVKGWPIVVVCLLAPCLSYWIGSNSVAWFAGYKIDIEILIINGAITWLGLFAISTKQTLTGPDLSQPGPSK
jgi:hypothetical protein